MEPVDEEESKVECDNCGQKIKSSSAMLHAATCARHLRKCALCGEVVRVVEWEQHQDSHKGIECEYCQTVIESSLMEMHVQNECTGTKKCPKCNQGVLLPEWDSHTIHGAGCGKSLVECQFCRLETAVEELESHEEFCGTRTQECESCQRLIMIRDFPKHNESGCVYPPVVGERIVASGSSEQLGVLRDRVLSDLLPGHEDPLAPTWRDTGMGVDEADAGDDDHDLLVEMETVNDEFEDRGYPFDEDAVRAEALRRLGRAPEGRPRRRRRSSLVTEGALGAFGGGVGAIRTGRRRPGYRPAEANVGLGGFVGGGFQEASARSSAMADEEDAQLQAVLAASLETGMSGGANSGVGGVGSVNGGVVDDDEDEALKAALAASLADRGATNAGSDTGDGDMAVGSTGLTMQDVVAIPEGEDDVELPCELCEGLYPMSVLQAHQRVCTGPPAPALPPPPSRIPKKVLKSQARAKAEDAHLFYHPGVRAPKSRAEAIKSKTRSPVKLPPARFPELNAIVVDEDEAGEETDGEDSDGGGGGGGGGGGDDDDDDDVLVVRMKQ